MVLAVVLLIAHKAFQLTPSYSSQRGSLQHTFVCKSYSGVLHQLSTCLVLKLMIKLLVATCRVNTAGSNASSQRAQLLYDKWVLDVPKLLDLAALYGPDNAGLVQQLMQQVCKSFLSIVIESISWSRGTTMLIEGTKDKHVALSQQAISKKKEMGAQGREGLFVISLRACQDTTPEHM